MRRAVRARLSLESAAPLLAGVALIIVVAGASPAGAQAIIKPVGPNTPVATPVRRATPAKPHGPAERVIVSINASYLTASQTFDDTRTFDLNAETASFTSDYAVEAAVGVDAGAFVRVWKGLAAGVAFTSYSDSRDIVIDGTLPHPLKFNSPRAISGTAAGDHEETAVHLQIAYIVPVGQKMSVVAFGGPSFFTVKQSVVTAIQFQDAYPYDEATFSVRRRRPAAVLIAVALPLSWFGRLRSLAHVRIGGTPAPSARYAEVERTSASRGLNLLTTTPC
jgi:hypothetical protein